MIVLRDTSNTSQAGTTRAGPGAVEMPLSGFNTVDPTDVDFVRLTVTLPASSNFELAEMRTSGSPAIPVLPFGGLAVAVLLGALVLVVRKRASR